MTHFRLVTYSNIYPFQGVAYCHMLKWYPDLKVKVMFEKYPNVFSVSVKSVIFKIISDINTKLTPLANSFGTKHL